jgi:hypothetical protein
MSGLEDKEADLVIRLLLVPTISRPIHPDTEETVRNRTNGWHIRGAKGLEIPPHAAASLLPR